MRLFIVGLLTLGSLGVCIALAQDDHKKLQGKWVPVSITVNGRKQSKKDFENFSLTLQGDNYIAKRDGKVDEKGTFSIDPEKMPKHFTTKRFKGGKTKAIYKLTGDKLILCGALEPGGKRPTSFDAKPGSFSIRIDLMRQQ